MAQRFPTALTPRGVAHLIARCIVTTHDLDDALKAISALQEQFDDLAAGNEMVANAPGPGLDEWEIAHDADWVGAMAAEFERQAQKARDCVGAYRTQGTA